MAVPPRPIQHIRDGEPVSAGVASRPDRELEASLKTLWDAVQTSGSGQTQQLRGVAVAENTVVGSPLYLADDGIFYGAQVAVTVTDGIASLSQSSQVCALVTFKYSARVADVLLFGYAQIDLSAAILDGAPSPGFYYLATTGSGRLTSQQPAAALPVLQLTAGNYVFFRPQFSDFSPRYQSRRIAIWAKPAGTHVPPNEGEHHEITNPDAELPGWLPADDPTFEGVAPAGAKFGYNIEVDDVLSDLWPLASPQTAGLEWITGNELVPGALRVDTGPDGLCLINEDGIWWMSDCYGKVPWAVDLDTTETSSESSESDECSSSADAKLFLLFSASLFNQDVSLVTSLRSADPRLRITCRDLETPASSGDLVARLELSQSVDSSLTPGDIVLKSLGSDGVFLQGPVAEGLYTTGDRLSLQGTRTRPLSASPGAPTLHQGAVRVELVDAEQLELQPRLTRLDGAIEAFSPILYLGLPRGYASGFHSRFDLPTSLPSGTIQLRYRLLLLGQITGTLPQLSVSYTLVDVPTTLNTPLTLTTSYTPLTITTNIAVSALQVVEVESEAISVSAGQILMVSVQRSADDSYLSEVGVVRELASMGIDGD